MKLITKELKERFAQVGEQAETNALVIAKYFNPCGSQTWYATEYDSELNNCYGYVTGMYVDEWGYFSIDELEQLALPFGLTIERDIHFTEKSISQCVPAIKRKLELERINKAHEQHNNQEHER